MGPVFDGHAVHDQVTDLNHLCFNLFIYILIYICFLLLVFFPYSFEALISGTQFLCRKNFLNTL